MGVDGAAVSGQAMASTLCEFIERGRDFDSDGLLPSEKEWIDFRPKSDTMMDIEAFSNLLGLDTTWTHTALVPPPVSGYQPEAHISAAGHRKGDDNKKGWGKGKA